MATRYSTATPADFNTFQYPAVSGIDNAVNHVAENSDDYDPKPVGEAEFPTALQAIRARSQRESAFAQIGRLLRLADLLDPPDPTDRSAEALAWHGQEIREAAILLEEAVCELATPLLKGRADD